MSNSSKSSSNKTSVGNKTNDDTKQRSQQQEDAADEEEEEQEQHEQGGRRGGDVNKLSQQRHDYNKKQQQKEDFIAVHLSFPSLSTNTIASCLEGQNRQYCYQEQQRSHAQGTRPPSNPAGGGGGAPAPADTSHDVSISRTSQLREDDSNDQAVVFCERAAMVHDEDDDTSPATTKRIIGKPIVSQQSVGVPTTTAGTIASNKITHENSSADSDTAILRLSKTSSHHSPQEERGDDRISSDGSVKQNAIKNYCIPSSSSPLSATGSPGAVDMIPTTTGVSTSYDVDAHGEVPKGYHHQQQQVLQDETTRGRPCKVVKRSQEAIIDPHVDEETRYRHHNTNAGPTGDMNDDTTSTEGNDLLIPRQVQDNTVSEHQQSEDATAVEEEASTNASIFNPDEQMLDNSSLPDVDTREEEHQESTDVATSSRQRRLAMNRATAKIRRDRKLQYLSDLEEQVQNMIESNNMFISQNNELREQIVKVKNEISRLQQMSASNNSMMPQSFISPPRDLLGGTSLPTSQYIDQQRNFLGNPSIDFIRNRQHGGNNILSTNPHELLNSIAGAESNASSVEVLNITQQQPYFQQYAASYNNNGASMPCSQNMSTTSLPSLASAAGAGINQTSTNSFFLIGSSRDLEVPERRIRSDTTHARTTLHPTVAAPMSTSFGTNRDMEQQRHEDDVDDPQNQQSSNQVVSNKKRSSG